MIIPEHIFFTGVPGSRWSGIAQTIETIPGFNTSDRTPERAYDHHAYSGHKGAYFGWGMEFDPTHIYGYKHFDQAWTEPGGHNSAKMLQEIQTQNTRILEYACEVDAKWEYFTPAWTEREFGHAVDVPTIHKDILVTIIK